MKQPDSYAYTRGMECVNEGKYEDAMDWMQKEISDHPDNGYAFFIISTIHAANNQNGSALSAINNAIKKIPSKDKEWLSTAMRVRADIYLAMQDTVKAFDDLARGLKIKPDNTNLLESRAQIYYEQGNFDLSDADYREMIKIDPSEIMGYMGIGRNENAREHWDEAIAMFDKVINLSPEYSKVYSFRAESYLNLEKYLEAINDITKSLSIDNDAKAHHELFKFPDNQTTLIMTKLKGMAVKNPHDAEWWYYIAQVYYDKKQYSEAIEALKKALEIDAYSGFIEMISDCYQELGEFSKALEYVNQALQMNPDDLDLISLKADILGEYGDIDGAIAEWSNYIDRSPDFYGGYYRRGFFEDNSDRTDAALEDYNMAIMLKPDYAYSYLGKGDMLLRKGQIEDALEAYRKVVELDTIPNNSSCAMYALLALGERDKAVDFMNQVIKNDSTYCGNYYDAACFYSRIGDLEKALENLRIAFEKGFRRFHHVKVDDDLEELRQTEAFKMLIEEYEHAFKNDNTTASSGDTEIYERFEIPFIPDGGCMSVKCSINELPLNFIFDTGASIISLSQVEANFMLKNGYLKREDFIGSGRFVDANGDISEGTVVNLRSVDFGGLKLNNVRASVVRTQKAPLLLGQSVLGRLGKIEIDNPGQKLVISHKVNKR
ncbi:MAG: tetratricopeptide repeat protein [Oscillospiraceae bacterium]|nr:tetratricopeptide repeat protein [Oscillospiraceae bacterium]